MFSLALAGPKTSTSAAPATAATWRRSCSETSHRRWDALTDGDVRAITLRQGIVYVGGHFNNYCQSHLGTGTPLTCTTPTGRRKFLALNQSTGHLTNWNPIGNSVQGAFAIRSTKTQVMAGGSFTNVHGTAQQGFVRWT